MSPVSPGSRLSASATCQEVMVRSTPSTDRSAHSTRGGRSAPNTTSGSLSVSGSGSGWCESMIFSKLRSRW
ncbi:Uncharacterised protein [Mycobacteroides abscessus subsp. abscessus]|nr:Uncharacterised protein [Mycobacteroides abscessus subsp. abscessus]